MNAIRSTQSLPLAPPPMVAGAARKRRRPLARKSHPHRTLAFETGGKLLVSLGVAIAATAGLVHLLPLALTQRTQLEDINQQVTVLESRVNHLQSDFGYRFDPQQTQRIMQEQSNRVAPGQVQVIWLDSTQHHATIPEAGAPATD